MNSRKMNGPGKAGVLLATVCLLASVSFGAETPLTNGVPLTGLSGIAGSETFYKITVPAGQDQLQILTTGGTGDVDLYVRFGALPTTTSYDYRPYKAGNEETVNVTSPVAGVWYIMLRGYDAYAGVTLKATYSAAVSIIALTNGVPVTGLSGAAASETYFKIDVPAGQSKLDISISGGTGDADLYVKQGAVPTTTVYDYRPYLTGNAESVSINNPTAAAWYIMIRGYASYTGLTLLATYGGGGAGTELENGVPVTGLSGLQASEKIYRIQVPTDQTYLEIAISGGTGDADLYVKFGSQPTTSSYDYRPYLAGNNETVTISNPTAGVWFIMIRGYNDYANLTLKATYGDVVTLQDEVPVTGLSAPLNGERHFKIVVPTGQSTLVIQTSGGTGNVDMYVKLGSKASLASWDYRANAAGNTDSITINNPAGGTWFVMLRATQAYSGVTLVADYTFEGTVVLLSNGVPVTSISGAEGSERIYRLVVWGSPAKLEISISGGTGDADLYVKQGSPPTSSQYDYRPYLIGNDESVTVNNPANGDWFMMIRGFHAYSGLTLLATFGGGTVPPEDVTTLTNGVPLPGQSGATDSEKFYKIDVPAGQSKLEITISGGTGDADLYVKKGAKPTTTSWDYRPYLIGNNETVSIDNPDAATWFIMLKGYAAYAGVTIVAIYSPVPEAVTTLTNGVPVTGLSGATSSEDFYKIDVPPGQDFLNIEISGGTGDADLYVKKGAKPTTGSWDYRPYLIGNNESVDITNPAAATWYVMIRGYQAYSGVTLVATYGVTTIGNNFAVDLNCVALWRFESGQLTVDSIGTNTLTPYAIGVASSTSDYQEGSGCVDLEQTQWGRLWISDVNLVAGFPLRSGDTNKKISICFWMKAESVPGATYANYVAAKGNWSDTTRSLAIQIQTSGSGNRLAFEQGYGIGNNSTTYPSNGTIIAGGWYHVGFTYDDASKAYAFRVWDDAASTLLTTTSGTTTQNIKVASGQWTIGNTATTNLNYNYDGLLDEMVVFNRVLSAAEIDKIRQGTFGKP
jgi:hypothetical protein